MIETENPSYFAVIPAEVRYDNELKPNAKLLYGEITCLSQKLGYCYASNSYFAELYEVNSSTISRWVKQLEEKGYIAVDYFFNGKECKERRIAIKQYLLQKEQKGIAKKSKGYCKKSKENNTRVNNTSINNTRIENVKNTFTPPTLEEVKKYVLEKGYSVDVQVFLDYYTATNWHDKDGVKVKSWKGKVVTWNSRNKRSTNRNHGLLENDKFKEGELDDFKGFD